MTLTQKLKEFKQFVQTNMIEFWNNPLEIQLSISHKMSDFSRREDLTGWIPGDRAFNTRAVVEEMARLTKENAELREKVVALSSASYEGLTFDEMYGLLTKQKLGSLRNATEAEAQNLKEFLRGIVESFGDSELNPLHFLWWAKDALIRDGAIVIDIYKRTNLGFTPDKAFCAALATLLGLGLLDYSQRNIWPEQSGIMEFENKYKLTTSGRQFLLRLISQRGG
jgi:hypothetical protein